MAMSQKDQQESNLLSPSPYHLRGIDEGFAFDTDFGITYIIRFTDDSDYLAESSVSVTILTFSISPINGEVKQKDVRVEVTIIQALMLTFEILPDVVINYVCSLEDNQEKARSRLFNSWFLKSGKDRFVKLDYVNQDDKIYTSAIFRRDHPAEQQIERLFEQVFDK